MMALPFNPPVTPLTLEDSDHEHLAGIPREIVERAGIFRVTSADGASIIGRGHGGTQDYSGIVFPNIWPGETDPRAYRLRLKNPGIRHDANGKAKPGQRYLAEPVAKNRLYFVPGTNPAMLMDISIPIVIGEGEKKTLAIQGVAESQSRRLLACSLSGVWNFRDRSLKGTGPNGQRIDINAPIADLSRVAWGRKAIIVYDPNVKTNPSVAAAQIQFAMELAGRGAEVFLVEIPEEESVNGIDDFVARHGAEAALALLDRARPFDPSEMLAKLFYSDLGHEQAFEILYGNKYVYNTTTRGFLMWNGTVYEPDQLNRADRDMIEVAHARLHATAKTVENALEFQRTGDARYKTKKAIAAVFKLQNVRGRQAALESVKSNPQFAHPAEDFDQQDLLFACANGVIDLATGKLRPGCREDMLTTQSPVTWDENADYSLWLEFLHNVFPHNPEIIEFLRILVGYCLTGLTVEEILVILHGRGRNGKGTFILVLMAVFGRFGLTTEFSTFLHDPQAGKRPRNDIAAFAGKRLITAQESNRAVRLDESLIKGLSGGDAVTARFLHQEFITFRPTWTIMLATNSRPEIHGTDVGIWSRLRMIPFLEDFSGREDRTLKRRLLEPASLSGVLRWAAEGCRDYLRDYYLNGGLQAPQSITAATIDYRHSQDLIGRFIDARTTRVDNGLSIKARDLYIHFVEWCRQLEIEPISETAFGLSMVERGNPKVRRSTGMIYPGIQIDQDRVAADLEAEAISEE